MKGIGLDSRIGLAFLQPGLGYGGSCFPKDVDSLIHTAARLGYDFKLLRSVVEINRERATHLIDMMKKALGPFEDKTVAVLGLAFKPNTDDMREASSLVLSARLNAAGARVRAYDPVAEEEARKLIRGVEFSPTALDAVEGADAVVLITEWAEFAQLDLREVAARMRGRLLVDGRNFLDVEAARAAGLTYEGIGRPGATVSA
jgi:UDPglucose 6-dehydrogenase